MSAMILMSVGSALKTHGQARNAEISFSTSAPPGAQKPPSGMQGHHFSAVKGTAKMPARIPDTYGTIIPAREDPSVLLAVRDGDSIVIRNADTIYTKPFSSSKGNAFKCPGTGLAPGQSMTITAKNNTDKPIRLAIFDEIHPRCKVVVLVLPTQNRTKSVQTAPTTAEPQITNGKGFSGQWASATSGDMNLTQSGNTVLGTYSASDGVLNGTVSGNVLRFHWYQNGNKRKESGKFTLSADGNSFYGTWNYGDDPDSGGQVWNGKRR